MAENPEKPKPPAAREANLARGGEEVWLLDSAKNDAFLLGKAKRGQKAFLRFLMDASADENFVEQVHRLRDAVVVSALREEKRKGGLTIGVTSPRGGEGGSLVSLLLTLSLGECATRRVTLLDGKFKFDRFAALAEMLGFAKSSVLLGKGFTDVAGHYNQDYPNIYFLRSVGCERGIRFFSDKRLGVFLKELRALFDFTVINIPPILKDTTSVFLLPGIDRLYLTVEASKTRLGEVARCVDMAKEAGRKLDGVIINKQKPPWWSRLLWRDFFY